MSCTFTILVARVSLPSTVDDSVSELGVTLVNGEELILSSDRMSSSVSSASLTLVTAAMRSLIAEAITSMTMSLSSCIV